MLRIIFIFCFSPMTFLFPPLSLSHFITSLQAAFLPGVQLDGESLSIGIITIIIAMGLVKIVIMIVMINRNKKWTFALEISPSALVLISFISRPKSIDEDNDTSCGINGKRQLCSGKRMAEVTARGE